MLAPQSHAIQTRPPAYTAVQLAAAAALLQEGVEGGEELGHPSLPFRPRGSTVPGQMRHRVAGGSPTPLRRIQGGATVAAMDYTQEGVLRAQVKVYERLRRVLAEYGVVLDPGSPLWFDGRLELPKPGEPWKMTLSCGGATSSVEFTPIELDAFLEVRPPEVVSEKLRRAVDALRPPKPQERGLA